jgi:hypothetical protein
MEIPLDLLKPKEYYRFYRLVDSETTCILIAGYI